MKKATIFIKVDERGGVNNYSAAYSLPVKHRGSNDVCWDNLRQFLRAICWFKTNAFQLRLSVVQLAQILTNQVEPNFIPFSNSIRKTKISILYCLHYFFHWNDVFFVEKATIIWLLCVYLVLLRSTPVFFTTISLRQVLQRTNRLEACGKSLSEYLKNFKVHFMLPCF